MQVFAGLPGMGRALNHREGRKPWRRFKPGDDLARFGLSFCLVSKPVCEPSKEPNLQVRPQGRPQDPGPTETLFSSPSLPTSPQQGGQSPRCQQDTLAWGLGTQCRAGDSISMQGGLEKAARLEGEGAGNIYRAAPFVLRFVICGGSGWRGGCPSQR